VHDWVDAFQLAAKDGVLVWVYENRKAFQAAQFAIRHSGWVVEHVAEAKQPVSFRRIALMGPAAWLGRRKRIRVTLRRQAEQARPERRNRRQKRARAAETVPDLEHLPQKQEAEAVPTESQLSEQPEEIPDRTAANDGDTDDDGLLYYRRKI
jgi:hypothetical protein